MLLVPVLLVRKVWNMSSTQSGFVESSLMVLSQDRTR
jgi:hypothetical protein